MSGFKIVQPEEFSIHEGMKFSCAANRYPASKHTPHKSTADYRKNRPNLTNNKIIYIEDINKLFNLL
jgi:hypothetical protein